MFCLMPSPTADPAAVKLATDLVSILGAKPLFLDPAEHDGLLGAVEQLPAVLALALLETAIHQPSWRELRKMAGASFEATTQAAFSDLAGFGTAFISNRENLLRWIDAFSSSLASIRQDLVEGQPEAFASRFEGVVEERAKWLHDRAEGQWDGPQGPEMPEKSSMIADAFLGGLWRKRPKRDADA
jgi:prephenate dehydrogenase